MSAPFRYRIIYDGMILMMAKMRKPSKPTSMIPNPVIFPIFEDSSQDGVLANFSTRTYDERPNLTSISSMF